MANLELAYIDEPVRDYVDRIHSSMKPVSCDLLRLQYRFHEVQEVQYSIEIELWCWRNTKLGEFYHRDNSWFFNDESTAAIFKLAHGKN